jgi:hypothetical protein
VWRNNGNLYHLKVECISRSESDVDVLVDWIGEISELALSEIVKSLSERRIPLSRVKGRKKLRLIISARTISRARDEVKARPQAGRTAAMRKIISGTEVSNPISQFANEVKKHDGPKLQMQEITRAPEPDLQRFLCGNEAQRVG